MEQQKNYDILSLSKEELENLGEDELKEVLKGLSALKTKSKSRGPQTDQQLWDWINDNLGIKIPKHNVCEDHDSPFTFVADLYFNRVHSAIVIANRGGMKTLSLAAIHFVNGEFKPGYWGLTFGAIDAQADRCYEHLEQWVKEPDDEGKLRPRKGIRDSLMKETNWINKSKVSVVGGTPSQVNGPHPQLAHADEAELMRQDTWDESRNMAVAAKTIINGEEVIIPAQNVITSTRKSQTGRMQSLVDENNKAEKKGYKVPYRIYIWCIFETAEQRPDCRLAKENEGRPDYELCECHRIAKGVFTDGSERTMDRVCAGKFYKSRGFKTAQEVELLFTENNPAVWVAQQECRKASTEHNYIPEFDEHIHGIRDYLPDPEYGEIYQGIDWGSGNPNAVTWYQWLRMPLIVKDFENNDVKLPKGSFVAFREIYEANIGATRLAQKVKREESIMEQEFGFPVRPKARFADPQGRQQRNDWQDEGLVTKWMATRDFEYHVERVQSYFVDGQFFVDVDECPMFVAEIEVWQRNPVTGKQVDTFNHVMSNMRYAVVNAESLDRYEVKTGKKGKRKHKKSPANIKKGSKIIQVKGPVATVKIDRSDWPDQGI